MKISCIMAVYKESIYQIHRSINSILSQSIQNFELIIVVDNPQNIEVIEVIKEYAKKDNRIKYYVNPKNLGASFTRNIGISLSQGDFIAIQDADDESYPFRFEKQLQFMLDNPDIDISGAGLSLKLESDNSIYYEVIPNENFEKSIKRTCPISGGILFLRSQSVRKYGEFPSVYSRAEDYYLQLKWFLAGAKFGKIDDILQNYFIQNNHISKSKRSVWQSIKMKWIYRKELKFKFDDYFYFISDLVVLFLLFLLPLKVFFKLIVFINKK